MWNLTPSVALPVSEALGRQPAQENAVFRSQISASVTATPQVSLIHSLLREGR